MKSVEMLVVERNVWRPRMLRLLTFGEQGVAALADHRPKGMGCCRDCRRTLPRADATAVGERSERVPVVARAL